MQQSDFQMSSININVLTAADWEIYKSIRLASLKESPDSFGSTYESEVDFSVHEWKSRIAPDKDPHKVLPLIAVYEGLPAGLAFAVIHDSGSGSANIYQMWVTPECRKIGLARALLNRITSWAKNSNLKSLLLYVTTTNTEAVSLYKSYGFLPIGVTEPLRDGSLLEVQPMELKLCNVN